MTATPEILTGADRATQTAETEPRLSLTELRGLLREAQAIERAQRPIVLHTGPAAAPVVVPLPSAAPAHEGIEVHVPQAAAARLRPCLHRVSGPLGRVSLAVALLGAGDAAWTQGSLVGLALMGVGLLGAAAGAGLGVLEENREARS